MQFMFDKCIPIEITPLVKNQLYTVSDSGYRMFVVLYYLLLLLYFVAQY